jgi:uncharacterized protein YaaQ
MSDENKEKFVLAAKRIARVIDIDGNLLKENTTLLMAYPEEDVKKAIRLLKEEAFSVKEGRVRVILEKDLDEIMGKELTDGN